MPLRMKIVKCKQTQNPHLWGHLDQWVLKSMDRKLMINGSHLYPEKHSLRLLGSFQHHHHQVPTGVTKFSTLP